MSEKQRYTPDKHIAAMSALDQLRQALDVGEDAERLNDILNLLENEMARTARDVEEEIIGSLGEAEAELRREAIERATERKEEVEEPHETIFVGDTYQQLDVTLDDHEAVVRVEGDYQGMFYDEGDYQDFLDLCRQMEVKYSAADNRDSFNVTIKQDELNFALTAGKIEFVESDEGYYELRPAAVEVATKEFRMGEHLRGKKIWVVEFDDRDALEGELNQPDEDGYLSDFGRHSVSETFEIEGVDGVVVATIDQNDGYRSHFGGWSLIAGLKGRRVRELGVIESFHENREEPSGTLDGYKNETIMLTTNGVVKFGTAAYDAYYPSGFCRVENRSHGREG